MIGSIEVVDTLQTASVSLPWEENLRFLGIKVINVGDLTELIIRFVFNTLLIYIVTQFLYAKNSLRKDFYFSYLAIGVIVFLLCFLLNNVKLELGFALGLFAIFGIIRYRTDTIPIKEMTYLFIIIGISVMNALSNKKVSYTELVFTNSAILVGLWILENKLGKSREESMKMVFEKIEFIHQDSKEQMLQDLKERTGLDITRYEVHKIDFLRDVTEMTLYYKPNMNT